MKKPKSPKRAADDDITVSIPRKKAAGAAAGAVVGGVMGGPVGAVVGGVVGTLMTGNTKNLKAAGARLARTPAVGKLQKIAAKKAGRAMKAVRKVGARTKAAAKSTGVKVATRKPPGKAGKVPASKRARTTKS